jgi:hypothetical protein
MMLRHYKRNDIDHDLLEDILDSSDDDDSRGEN